MIYILGMSHMLPVLGACSAKEGQSIITGEEPAFIDWDTKPGMFPRQVKAASIYRRHITPYWGECLAVQKEPGVLSFAGGFKKLLDSINADSGNSILFVFMNGEEYYLMAESHDALHDFYMPWHTELSISPHLQVIPLEIIKRQVGFNLSKALAAFSALHSFLPGFRIVNVICPPPPDFDCYSKNTIHPAKLPTHSINYSVRLKYYLLYRSILKAAVSSAGIESLMPPPETVREDGLLRSEYAADGFHGNLLYGNSVCVQMNELLPAGVN